MRTKPHKKSICIILMLNKKYHLCSKFGLNKNDASVLIDKLKQTMPNFNFSTITREYHLQTQWDNRNLNYNENKTK